MEHAREFMEGAREAYPFAAIDLVSALNDRSNAERLGCGLPMQGVIKPLEAGCSHGPQCLMNLVELVFQLGMAGIGVGY